MKAIRGTKQQRVLLTKQENTTFISYPDLTIPPPPHHPPVYFESLPFDDFSQNDKAPLFILIIPFILDLKLPQPIFFGHRILICYRNATFTDK